MRSIYLYMLRTYSQIYVTLKQTTKCATNTDNATKNRTCWRCWKNILIKFQIIIQKKKKSRQFLQISAMHLMSEFAACSVMLHMRRQSDMFFLSDYVLAIYVFSCSVLGPQGQCIHGYLHFCMNDDELVCCLNDYHSLVYTIQHSAET